MNRRCLVNAPCAYSEAAAARREDALRSEATAAEARLRAAEEAGVDTEGATADAVAAVARQMEGTGGMGASRAPPLFFFFFFLALFNEVAQALGVHTHTHTARVIARFSGRYE